MTLTESIRMREITRNANARGSTECGNRKPGDCEVRKAHHGAMVQCSALHNILQHCTVLYYWPQTQIAGPARASRIQDTEAGWFGLVVLAPGQACSGQLMDGNV